MLIFKTEAQKNDQYGLVGPVQMTWIVHELRPEQFPEP